MLSSIERVSPPFQITRRVRRTLITTKVNAAEAERKQWTKFGKEKGRSTGPHSSTTTVGESILLKMSAGNKHVRLLAQ